MSFFILSFVISQAQQWIQLTTAGSSPSGRYGHTGVYDSNDNRMIIFGGNISGVLTNEVWVLTNCDGISGTTTWIQLTTTGSPPPSRYTHSAVYDLSNNRMIIFGGYDGANWKNDVWVLNNANGLGGTPTWTQLSPTGGPPHARAANSAVYDPNNNIMITFDGGAGGSSFNDVWVLTNANGLGGTPAWSQLSITGSSPTTRTAHTAIYDSTNNIMTIFGGNIPGSAYLNDTWVLSYANGSGGTPTWTQLSPTGSLPTTRWYHTVVSNTVNNQMVIFGGGYFGGPYLDDTWILTNSNGLGGTPAWNEILPTGSKLTTRELHCSIYNPNTDRMTIFGGYNNGSSLNDTWVLTNVSNGTPIKDWMDYIKEPDIYRSIK